MGLESTKARLLAAENAGHRVGVQEVGPERWICSCSCGWSSTSRRSVKAVNQTLSFHIGQAIGLRR